MGRLTPLVVCLVALVLCSAYVTEGRELLAKTSQNITTGKAGNTTVTKGTANSTVGGGNTTGGPTAVFTGKWPTDSGGNRFKGGKEYVIILHDRIALDMVELNAFLNKSRGKRNRHIRALRTQIKQHRDTLKPYYRDIQKINDKKVFKTIKRLKIAVQAKLVRYRAMELKLRGVEHNWNRTIGSINSQLNTAEKAVKDINTIYKMLSTKRRKTPDVADMLNKVKKRYLKNPKLVSFIEMAVEKSKTITDTEEVKKIIALLQRQILNQVAKLKIDVAKGKLSKQAHLKRMRVKMNPIKFQIEKLNRELRVAYKAAAVIKMKIDHIRKKNMAPTLKAIQILRNRIQQVKDAHKLVKASYQKEIASVGQIAASVETLHQIVKQRLVAGSDKDIAVLNAIKNTLKPRGKTVLQWNPNLSSKPYKCNKLLPNCQISQAIDPKDANANLCASWKFDEPDGQRFALDSSRSGFDGKIHGHNLLRVRSQASLGHKGGLSFDGSQAYVDVGKLGTFGNSLNQFTFDFWVRTINTDPSLSSIFKVIDNGLGQVVAIDVNRRLGRLVNGKWPTGQQRTAVTDFQSGATLVYLRDSTGKVLAGHVLVNYFDNRWHNIRWTVQNAKLNRMSFFLDDKRIPFVATVEQSPTTFHNLGQNVYVGAGNNRGHPEGFFDGALHGVRLFCTADWNATKPVPLCCRTCNVTTAKACGDMCIPKNATCMLEAGCACNGTVPEGKNKGGWPMRGNSTINAKSLFTNNPDAVPTSQSKFIVPREPLVAPKGEGKPSPGAGKHYRTTQTPAQSIVQGYKK